MAKKYEVEKVENHKPKSAASKSQAKHYLIKWKNYPISDNTWEPASNMNLQIPTMIQFYWAQTFKENDKTEKGTMQKPNIIPRKPGRKSRKAIGNNFKTVNDALSEATIDSNCIIKLKTNDSNNLVNENLENDQKSPGKIISRGSKRKASLSDAAAIITTTTSTQNTPLCEPINNANPKSCPNHNSSLHCLKCDESHNQNKFRITAHGKKYKFDCEMIKIKGVFIRKAKKGLIISSREFDSYLFVELTDIALTAEFDKKQDEGKVNDDKMMTDVVNDENQKIDKKIVKSLDNPTILTLLQPKIEKYLKKKNVANLDEVEAKLIK